MDIIPLNVLIYLLFFVLISPISTGYVTWPNDSSSTEIKREYHMLKAYGKPLSFLNTSYMSFNPFPCRSLLSAWLPTRPSFLWSLCSRKQCDGQNLQFSWGEPICARTRSGTDWFGISHVALLWESCSEIALGYKGEYWDDAWEGNKHRCLDGKGMNVKRIK